VKRALDRTLTVDLLPQTSAYGEAFEHFVFTEIVKLNSYGKKDFSFSYLRTKDDVEIDLIIERPGRPIALVEIKSSTQIKDEHVNALIKIAKDFENAECFCLSLDKTNKIINGVDCLYFTDGIKALGL
jgi:predicted AAA+ superfamily ATPase